MGILYFIQPAELVGTNRFKVGCSTKNDLSRVKTYKAGTRMIMILQCEDPFLLEQKVLVEFKNQFHKIAGNEYFEGDESVMRKVFYDTYLKWEHHKKDGIAKWRNDKLKEQQQRLAQLQKDLEVLRLEIVQGEAYLERVMCGDEDEAILAKHAPCSETDKRLFKRHVEKVLPTRPKNMYEIFKIPTVIYHKGGKMNKYAITSGLPDGKLYSCGGLDTHFEKTGKTYSSLNDFAKQNYIDRTPEKFKDTRKSVNAFLECQFMGKGSLMYDCILLDMNEPTKYTNLIE